MKQIMIITMLTLAIMLTGCQSVLKATAENTSPDGTVVKTSLTLRSSGDKMSELAAEGAFAEALTDHPAAGVNKAGAKQESSGTDAILAAIIQPLVNGLVSAYTFRPATTATQIEQGCGDYTFAGGISGSSNDAVVAGFGAVPGEGGSGVYGSPDCSRCQAYIRTHGVELIDYWQYRSTALAALKARGFSGSTVQFPLKITEESYQMMAK